MLKKDVLEALNLAEKRLDVYKRALSYSVACPRGIGRCHRIAALKDNGMATATMFYARSEGPSPRSVVMVSMSHDDQPAHTEAYSWQEWSDLVSQAYAAMGEDSDAAYLASLRDCLWADSYAQYRAGLTR